MKSELKFKIEKVKISCKTCGIDFTSDKICKSRTPKFCTKKCYAISLLKPRKPKQPLKNRKGILLSPEWRRAISEGRKRSAKCKGENLYNWKGGKSTELLRMKASIYKRRLNLKKDFDQQFLSSVLIAQKHKCFFCESEIVSYKAIEHLTPVSRGGDNDNYNLVYSCKSCNSQKRQNTLEEFAIKKMRFDWLDKFDLVYATAINSKEMVGYGKTTA